MLNGAPSLLFSCFLVLVSSPYEKREQSTRLRTEGVLVPVIRGSILPFWFFFFPLLPFFFGFLLVFHKTFLFLCFRVSVLFLAVCCLKRDECD